LYSSLHQTHGLHYTLLQMGLDDFAGGSGSTGGGGGGGQRSATRLDFSRDYVKIVRRMDEQIAADVGVLRVIKPEDDLEEDYEVLCSFSDRLAWKAFRDRVSEEFNLDADEVLEENPEQIPELKRQLAKPEPRSPTRTCVVCGEEMRPDSSSFQELRLARDGSAHAGADRLPVHEDHTIEELVRAKEDA